MVERFEPTAEQRRLVKTLAGFGVRHDDIARQVGIDPKTLRLRLRDELDRGSTEATAKVAQSLFQMATQGKNVAAAIFWMKARAGWRDVPDNTIDAQVPVQVIIQKLDGEDGPRAIARAIDGEAEVADGD